MPDEGKDSTAYQITEAACRLRVKGLVCPRCGGLPPPLETEDNSGQPTFWPVCCGTITWGVPPEVYKIAAQMVDSGHVEYGRRIMALPGSDDLTQGEDYRAYYTKEQISGTCGAVAEVLGVQAELADRFEYRVRWRSTPKGRLRSVIRTSLPTARNAVARLIGGNARDVTIQRRPVDDWTEVAA